MCSNEIHNGTPKEEQPSAESPTESTLNAAHLLVSAMEGKRKLQTKKKLSIQSSAADFFFFFLVGLTSSCVLFNVFIELPKETLELLSKSAPDFLQAFNMLVS